MTDYAAFLRGINVGGHHTVTMQALQAELGALGFSNVSTFRASGNVRFTSDRPPAELEEKIARALGSAIGAEVGVFVRPITRLRSLAGRRPFPALLDPAATPYASFLKHAPSRRPHLPLRSPGGDIEVFDVDGAEVLSLGRRIGKLIGFPNGFVEASFGVPATTRNWSTVLGMVPEPPPMLPKGPKSALVPARRAVVARRPPRAKAS